MKITVPEKTLLAFAQQGEIKSALRPDGGDRKNCLRHLRTRAWMCLRWPQRCSAMARRHLQNHGMN